MGRAVNIEMKMNLFNLCCGSTLETENLYERFSV